jgi:hypothetical protein
VALAGVIGAAGAGAALHGRFASRQVAPAHTPPSVPTQPPPASPAPRPTPTWQPGPFGVTPPSSVAWDSTHHVAVAFARPDVKIGEIHGHTWTWDGTWRELHPSTSPDMYSDGVLVDFPPVHGVVLLGHDPESIDGPTDFGSWAWDGSTWRRLGAAGFGECLVPTTAAWDAARRYAVFVIADECTGGTTELPSETWTYDGRTWRRHGGLPAGAFQPLVAWDAGARTTLLLAGFGGTARAWRWSGSAWVAYRASSLTYPLDPEGAAWDAAVGAVVLYAPRQYDGAVGPRMLAIRSGVWSELQTSNYPGLAAGIFSDGAGRLLTVGTEPIDAVATPPPSTDFPDYFMLKWAAGAWRHLP